mgnify:CR=1 FL=1|jgi:hypothetical protein
MVRFVYCPKCGEELSSSQFSIWYKKGYLSWISIVPFFKGMSGFKIYSCLNKDCEWGQIK